MLLSDYVLQVQQLLSNPAAKNTLYSESDILSYINRARIQLAGDAECIRNYATLNLVDAQRQYSFSDVVLTAPATGIAGIFNIRALAYQVGEGQRSIRPRPWAWFLQYRLNNPVPPSGPPVVWSQYGQGETGSIFIDPLPDIDYVCPVDTVCVPIDLVDDTTVEAIPDPYTNAVCYFAAYLAFLSSQNGARQNDALRMMELYTQFKNKARTQSTPSILPNLYEQTPNPVKASVLGLQQPAGGQQ